MVKISTIFGLGILVVLTATYLNLPSSWENFIYVISGILIAVLSVLIRRELHEVLIQLHSEEIKTDTFSESAPKQDASNS